MRESGGLRELLTEGGATGAGLRPPGRRRGAGPQPLHDAAADDARLRERLRLRPRARPAPGAGGRARGRRAGHRGDRRRRPAPSAVRAGRTPPRAHGRAALDARADRALQPARAAGHRGAAGARTRPGCRSAFRSPPGATATTSRSRSRSQLERAFGGWVPPANAADRPGEVTGAVRASVGRRAPPWPLLDGELAFHALVAVAVDRAVDLVGTGLEIDAEDAVVDRAGGRR